MKNKLWILVWKPMGTVEWYKAFILAYDSQEANYIFNRTLRKDEKLRESWHLARDFTSGHATFREATEDEKNQFKRAFPRRRKEGFYFLEKTIVHYASDHLND